MSCGTGSGDTRFEEATQATSGSRIALFFQSTFFLFAMGQYANLHRSQSSAEAPASLAAREAPVGSIAFSISGVLMTVVIAAWFLVWWSSFVQIFIKSSGSVKVEAASTLRNSQASLQRRPQYSGDSTVSQGRDTTTTSTNIGIATSGRQQLPDYWLIRIWQDWARSPDALVLAIRLSWCCVRASSPLMCGPDAIVRCAAGKAPTLYDHTPDDTAAGRSPRKWKGELRPRRRANLGSRIELLLVALETAYAEARQQQEAQKDELEPHACCFCFSASLGSCCCPVAPEPHHSGRRGARAKVAQVAPDETDPGSSYRLSEHSNTNGPLHSGTLESERLDAESCTQSAVGKYSASGFPEDQPAHLPPAHQPEAGLHGHHSDTMPSHIQETAAEGLRFTATASMPVIALAVGVAVAMLLDVTVSPGRGNTKATVIAVLWPLVAPFDHEVAIMPWWLLQLAYTGWTLVLFVAVSLAGDAWPLGRQDIDLLPEEHRYSFTSPLGLNGLNIVMDQLLFSLFTPIVFVAVLGIEQEYLRWRAAVARHELADSVAAGRRQQAVVVQAVVEQVPPFAQACMEEGVMAFEARPVVMAVTCTSGWEAVVEAESKSGQGAESSGFRLQSAGMTTERDPTGSRLRQGSTDSARGVPLVFTGVREQATVLCAALDAGCGEQTGLLDGDNVGQEAYRGNVRSLVSRGFIQAMCRRYGKANRGNTETSAGAAALGVLSKAGRKALFELSRLDWGVIGREMQVDKTQVGSELTQGVQTSVWAATAGLRTPVRSQGALSYSTRRVASAFACLAALERFLLGAMRVRERGVLLRCGLAYPSSSQTAMVVGLLGLQQQPHEWAAFGGGQAEARRQVQHAGSFNVGVDEESELISSLGSSSLISGGGVHVACLSVEAAHRVVGVLQQVQKAVDASVQWHLAIATDARTDGQSRVLLPRGLGRNSTDVSDSLAPVMDKSGGMSAQQHSDISVQLGQSQALQQSLGVLLRWFRHSIGANGNQSDSVLAGSNTEGHPASDTAASLASSAVKRSNIDQSADSQCIQQSLQSAFFAVPCMLGGLKQAASGAGGGSRSTNVSLSVRDALVAVRQVCEAVRTVSVPRGGTSGTLSINGMHQVPRWLATVVRLGSLPTPTTPTSRTTESKPHIDPASRAKYHELDPSNDVNVGAVTSAFLPGLLQVEGSPTGSSTQTGLALRSGILMALVGALILQQSVTVLVVTVGMEVAAEILNVADFANVMLHAIPLLPRVLTGMVMVWLGVQAHMSRQQLSIAAAVSAYGVGALTIFTYHLLLTLEVVQPSCFARRANVQPAAAILVVAQFVSGFFVVLPHRGLALVLGIAIAFLVPLGPYVILQAALEGTAVRTQREAAEACAAVWGESPQPQGMDRVSVSQMFFIFFGALLTIHFVLIQLVRGADMRVALQDVGAIADRAMSVMRQTRRQLQVAASAILPRAVIMHKIRSTQGFERTSTQNGKSFSQYFPGSELPRMSQKSGNRPSVPMQRIDLGHSVVATLLLAGFDSIADLAGPVASLGLHRRVGAEVDAVCSKYGAIRVRGSAGRFCVGWFESQQAGWKQRTSAGGGDGRHAAKGSAAAPGLKDKAWLPRALVGAVDLLVRVRAVLRDMSLQLRPVVGVADGRVSATWVGRGPAQILYADKGDGAGAMGGSAWIARSLARAGRGLGDVADEASVGISESTGGSIQTTISEMGVFMGRRLCIPDKQNSARCGSDVRLVAWRELAAECLYRDTGHTGIGSVVSFRIQLDISGNGQIVGVRQKAQARQPIAQGKLALSHWQEDQREALLQSFATKDGGDIHEQRARNPDVALWLRECIECVQFRASGSSRSCRDLPSPLQSSERNTFTAASAAISTDAAVTALHILVQPDLQTLRSILVVDRGITISETLSIAPAAQLPRAHMDDYHRLKVLGEGGFARVYLAVHVPTGRRVALKVSRKGTPGAQQQQHADGAAAAFSAGHSGRRASLKADVVRGEVLALLRCGMRDVPGACRLEGVVVGRREVGIVLELIDGDSLATVLRKQGPRMRLGEEAVRVVARQVACTLHGMHEAGVLHRDIKPSNIMVDGRGNARLVDFGLATNVWSYTGQAGAAGRKEAGSHWTSGELEGDDDLHLVMPLYAPLQLEHKGQQEAVDSGADQELSAHGQSGAVTPVTALLVQLVEAASTGFGYRMRYREQLEAMGSELEAAVKRDDGEPSRLCVSVACSLGEMRAMLQDEPNLYDCVVGVQDGSISGGGSAIRSRDATMAFHDVFERPKGRMPGTVTSHASCNQTDGLSSSVVESMSTRMVVQHLHQLSDSTKQRWVVHRLGFDRSEGGHTIHTTTDLAAMILLAGGRRQCELQETMKAAGRQGCNGCPKICPSSWSTDAKGFLLQVRDKQTVGGDLAATQTAGSSRGSHVEISLQGAPESLGRNRSATVNETNKIGEAGGQSSSIASEGWLHSESSQQSVRRTTSGSATARGTSSRRAKGAWTFRNRGSGTTDSDGPANAPCNEVSEVGSSGMTHDFWLQGSSPPHAKVGYVAERLEMPHLDFSTSFRAAAWHIPEGTAQDMPDDMAGAAVQSQLGSNNSSEREVGSGRNLVNAVDSRAIAGGGKIHREEQAFVAGIAGTPLFMAPELFKHQGQRGSDYWSLGVTLFWLLAGRMPFEGTSPEDQLRTARKGRVSWHLLPGDLSGECLDLLRGLLEVRAERRYDGAVLAGHPWLLPRSEAKMQELIALPISDATSVVSYRWRVDDPYRMDRDREDASCIQSDLDREVSGKASRATSSAELPGTPAVLTGAASGGGGISPYPVSLKRHTLSCGPASSLLGAVMRGFIMSQLDSDEARPEQPQARKRRTTSKRILKRGQVILQEAKARAALVMYYRRRQVMFRMAGILGGSARLVQIGRRRDAAIADLSAAGVSSSRTMSEILQCENDEYMQRLERAAQASAVKGGGFGTSVETDTVRAMKKPPVLLPFYRPRGAGASAFGVGVGSLPSVLESEEGQDSSSSVLQ